MVPVEKSYFFYKNTPEYKKIQNRLDWSIVAIIYTCAISKFIGCKYDFFINIIIAIATGYIISYFYFKIVTYKDIVHREYALKNILYNIEFYIKSVEISCINRENEILKDIDRAYVYADTYAKTCVAIDANACKSITIIALNYKDLYSELKEKDSIDFDEIMQCTKCNRIEMNKYYKIFEDWKQLTDYFDEKIRLEMI